MVAAANAQLAIYDREIDEDLTIADTTDDDIMIGFTTDLAENHSISIPPGTILTKYLSVATNAGVSSVWLTIFYILRPLNKKDAIWEFVKSSR